MKPLTGHLRFKPRRRKAPKGPQSYGPAGPAVSRITGHVFQLDHGSKPSRKRPAKRRKYAPEPVRWPIYVTTGPLTANGLTVHVLKSREHADSLGFDWVGRP